MPFYGICRIFICREQREELAGDLRKLLFEEDWAKCDLHEAGNLKFWELCIRVRIGLSWVPAVVTL